MQTKVQVLQKYVKNIKERPTNYNIDQNNAAYQSM